MKLKKKRVIEDPVGDICSNCPKLKSTIFGLKCSLYYFEVFGCVKKRTLLHWLIRKLGRVEYQCKAASLIEQDFVREG